MGIRSSRPHNPTKKQFITTADKIAQLQGYKDHADAVAHLKVEKIKQEEGFADAYYKTEAQIGAP